MSEAMAQPLMEPTEQPITTSDGRRLESFPHARLVGANMPPAERISAVFTSSILPADNSCGQVANVANMQADCQSAFCGLPQRGQARGVPLGRI